MDVGLKHLVTKPEGKIPPGDLGVDGIILKRY
jgi:hypothetical protein